MIFDRCWNILLLRLRSILRRDRVERELAKELRFHLEQQQAENLSRGLTAASAQHAAARRFGGITQIEEECRDMRRVNQIDSTLQDLRYATRALIRAPGFSITIVLTMALAIGANSAIFSVIDSVLLRPLPYFQPHRLVRLFLHGIEFPKFPLNPNDFRDYRERSQSFESLAAYMRNDLQLSGSGTPERLSCFAITAGFFHVLGKKPSIGREFNRNDELLANGHSVILSSQLWRSRFASRPDIVGQKVVLNGSAFSVVGVMPDGTEHPGNNYHAVAYGQPIDIWVPLSFSNDSSRRGSHFIDGIGRLKDGVGAVQAEAELNAVMAQMGREHEDDRGWGVTISPLQNEIVGGTQRLLWILLGSVIVVLLIACVNAANLLLSRATVRERELSLRAALGAGRSRLIRLLLTESLLISFAGALCGAFLAVAGVRLLASRLPADFPRVGDIHVNTGMFLFTLLVALATGILFGLAPAWQGSHTDLRSSLHESGRSLTGSSRSLRLRNGLVISEVALACLLMVGAGLMLRSFFKLLQADPGFRAQHVLTAGLSLRTVDYDYAKPELFTRFYDQLLNRLGSAPGVTFAGAATDLPWTGYDENGGFLVEGKTPPPDSGFHARYHSASPNYFRALGIPLLHGRFFEPYDRKGGPRSLLINQAMANRYWPGENAVGKRVSFGSRPQGEGPDWRTVVGIVGDVKDAPAKDAAEAAFWWPLIEVPFPDVSVVVQSRSEPALVANQLRSAVHSLDPNLAVADILSMDQIAAHAYQSSQFALSLISLFAGLALFLAAIGTYGVISYSMNQRSHEFGLRIALGAQPLDLLGFVFAHGMKLALAGALIGAACSMALARTMANLLYQVGAHDPLTIVGACLVTLITAALACYVPARRATRSNPIDALRNE